MFNIEGGYLGIPIQFIYNNNSYTCTPMFI